MNETLREIRLYGELGRLFGRVHWLAVKTTHEAVRALCALRPGFERHLMESEERGVAYACFLGKTNINVDQLKLPGGDQRISIAPIIQAHKNGGIFQIVLGAALVVGASIIAGPAGGMSLSAALAGGGAVAVAATMGISMMLTGIAGALTQSQKGLSTSDGPDNGASYNFNGPVNTTAQGNPVPLIYGEVICGSATISVGVFNEEI